MAETRNIVILGASYAGINTAHYFLRHVQPKLPSTEGTRYRVTLVNPSTTFYQRHASPRAAAAEGLISDEQMFLDIPTGLKQYDDAVTFVQGKAASWSRSERTVTIVRSNGSEEAPRRPSPLLSNQGTPDDETKAALRLARAQLATAKTIVIAGGGPAGVETAAEIGEHLNGAAGCLSYRPAHPRASITIITNGRKLLPALRDSIAHQAEVYLNRVGVDVQYETKVTTTRPLPDGRTAVTLHDGAQVEADVYIPATGAAPMSEWLPAGLRNGRGQVEQDARTLRVAGAGARVYAVGDVGSASRGTIIDIFAQVPVLMTNVKRDLLAAHENLDARPTGPDREYEADVTETQIVPVGRSKGVGAAFGWRLPSVFIWYVKGRDYMLGHSEAMMTGEKWSKEVAWKGGVA